MDESPVEIAVDTEKLSVESSPSNDSQPTLKELAAKAIAPVKKEFLRPPPPRPSSTSTGLQYVDVVVSSKDSTTHIYRT